jgi:hypothetical protein
MFERFERFNVFQCLLYQCTTHTELEQQGLLNNTYFIYTGDNGFHIGAYRQGSGKETAYETDIK